MTAALFRQDWVSTRKMLTAIFAAATLIVALCAALATFTPPVLSVMATVFGAGGTALVLPGLLLALTWHYWQSMYGRRGYFTMTIPVRGSVLFWTKILFAETVITVGLLWTAIAAYVLFAAQAINTGTSVGELFAPIYAQLSSQPGVTTIVWFVGILMVTQFWIMVIEGAAVMSIGAESRFNHLGFAAPVIGWLALNVISQILTLITMLLVPFALVLTGPGLGSIKVQNGVHLLVESFGTSAPQELLPLGFIPAVIAIVITLAIWGTNSVERHTSLR